MIETSIIQRLLNLKSGEKINVKVINKKMSDKFNGEYTVYKFKDRTVFNNDNNQESIIMNRMIQGVLEGWFKIKFTKNNNMLIESIIEEIKFHRDNEMNELERDYLYDDDIKSIAIEIVQNLEFQEKMEQLMSFKIRDTINRNIFTTFETPLNAKNVEGIE